MKTSILILVAALSVLSWAQPLQAQSGEDLFQRALVLERSNGQVREAIPLYERIVKEFASDRALAARALIRLGLAHEALGDLEAREAYQRVLRDFGDQAEMASQARARLAALAEDAPEPPADQATRLLLKDPDGCIVWGGIRPSPDGTRVVYSSLCSTGALIIRDLASGDTTVLVSDAYYEGPVWSPDGTRIATLRMDSAGGGLRILDARTGTDRTPDAVSGISLAPRDWVGSYVAGVIGGAEQTTSAAVVSLTTGRVVRLSGDLNVGARSPSLSPDGRYVAFSDFVGDNQDVFVATVEGTDRRRITSGNERDASPLWSPDGDLLIWENQNGLWAVPMTGGTPAGSAYGVRKEGLFPTAWTTNGIYHIVQNFVAESYHIPVDPGTGRPAGAEERLPAVVAEGAQWMAWSPDMSRLAMGSWDGIMRIYTPSNGSVTEFPMGAEFLPSLVWWSADGREILFTTAARARRDKRSTVYALNPGDGSVRELFPGLDSIAHLHVSPDGRKMTFITNLVGPGPKELRVTDLGRGEGVVLASAPGPDGEFGLRYGQPVFSPDGSNVLFLRVRGTAPEDYRSALWIAPADGSAPARMLVSSSGAIYVNAFWSPDGRNVAFTDVEMRTGRGALSVVSVESGQRHDVLTFVYPRGGTEPAVTLKYWSPDGRYLGITRTTGTLEFWVATDVLGQNGRGGGR